MAEHYDYDEYDGTTSTTTEAAPSRRADRRGVDAFTLVIGVLTLLVSAYVISDGASWLPSFDLRWALAGSAILVGVLMLGASLSGGRRKTD
ncbi:hypothetical protein [Amycolatopsis nigrescens]|uniref:hypothetical protein n=1 Tax=Amycolatopsis nigrescens TaxID=381445 RepID=UPI000370B379|nr:hypothetical protein [Amycolatopsis nigrescens]